MDQFEKPVYVLPQNKKRALIPKIILLVILGTIFYLGLLINLALLDLLGSEETTIKTVSLILISVIVILGILLSVRKANKNYLFYHDRVVFNKKETYYTQISNTSPKINIVDKTFNTYSIVLRKKMVLRNIEQEIDLQTYLQSLINYSRKS